MLAPFFGPMNSGSAAATITIAANVSNFNIITALGYVPGAPITITLVVNAAVVVSSASTAQAAMDLTGLPTGSIINLTNNGYILGRGGNGGNGGYGTAGTAGGSGGTAISCMSGTTLNITNASGNVWGGGGGGGGGGADRELIGGEFEQFGGGGGGGGAGVSSGGSGGAAPFYEGDDGSAGTGGSAGAGGAGGTNFVQGGAGGAYGAAGTAGTTAWKVGGAGGAAGYYVRSNGATISWVSGGTAPNVKGSAD